MIDRTEEGLRVHGSGCRPVNLKTLPHPGFPTDMQAPMMALMYPAGNQMITETVFENRSCMPNLKGWEPESQSKGAVPLWKVRPQGEVKATDLRAGAVDSGRPGCGRGNVVMDSSY